MPQRIVIGLSAVVAAVSEGEARMLTVRSSDQPAALPFGPFDPEADRTFEIALRSFVSAQTGFDPGYVEQLYTFGDKGRDAPLAAVDGSAAARVISVGYLGLTARADTAAQQGASWSTFTGFFPWEDWREGRPEALVSIEPALRNWAGQNATRLARARLLFALDDAPWNEERVLERYELLYEAGLAPEAARDRGEAPDPAIARLGPALGEPMLSDHRRILATALSRLRGKLKYRPVIFEMMPEAFTLSALQRAVEAVAGVALHKQNFRRALERSGLVEGLGRLDQETGGRPAELFRFRRETLSARPASGLSLPLLRD
ncbi:MAG: NAD regulator [Phenylobacterium sp.]|uniref:NUDIX hydrolase n=1 Tax=Phenylobacterium sp. TaxID=1871053 RepID=UPI0025E1A29E|nr:NAD regulator [Phenylobacterium sp.]MCA6225146.1 NAD regulator [Phenylobacterium sp.]MCA6227076.1 NAD regulator [Phenylobacterium sp.]MCA6230693.1 NAD regulator [Phenylobacterium sp.]MCA6234073.1 NAD regulator [Phenylobacterium sp.]MCA6249873.1 NAD regulator [Phenylobacterium sp.]